MSIHYLPSNSPRSTDIKLYRLLDRPSSSQSSPLPANLGCRVSDQQVAEVQRILPEPPHYIKCVEVNPLGLVGPDAQCKSF